MTGYVDAHHHLWVRAEHPQTWMDPSTMSAIDRDFDEADFDATATQAGVSASIVVQTVHVAAETDHLLRRAGRSGVVAGVVGWADLTAPDLADQLARWREGPGGDRLVGLRHVAEAELDPNWLRREDVLRGLRTVGENGLVFDLLVRLPQLPAAIAAVRATPGTQFVLDHLAKPPLRTGDLTRWAAQLRLLAIQANVNAKVSGLVTEADWATWQATDLSSAVDVAIAEFGPQRLMFGTDWPVCLLAATYGGVVATTETLLVGLSDAERQSIFEGTARRVYGI